MKSKKSHITRFLKTRKVNYSRHNIIALTDNMEVHKVQEIDKRTLFITTQKIWVKKRINDISEQMECLKQSNNIKVVARTRFELVSTGPKPAMLDHYTTGLCSPLSDR